MFHHHDHHDHHGHDHHHGADEAPATFWRLAPRLAACALILAAAGFAATGVTVSAGEAGVVTRLGDLSRVLTQPGLAWKLPAPIESVIPVDLRLRTTSTGLQDVGTKDGLRILTQAFLAWRVGSDPEAIRQFVRSVRNDPDEAARQLRTLAGAALQVTASSFELADLVDLDPARRKLPEFEARLQAQIAATAERVYGIQIVQVGIERLTLPDATLTATVSRMRSERETVAAARTAEGLRQAAEIRSAADRDARIALARARTQAAEVEAQSREEAAGIEARAYASDPDLYVMFRTMDTLSSVVGPNTRLVLRTDSAPFEALVRRPEAGASVKPASPVGSQGGAEPAIGLNR